MNLSAPVFVLKRQAKALKLEKNLSLHEALDLVAQREGYASWSLLAQQSAQLLPRRLDQLYGYLNPGDLALVASRPGMGKTLLACGIVKQALEAGVSAGFYSLAEHYDTLRERLVLHSVEPVNAAVAQPKTLDAQAGEGGRCWLDCSDEICAAHIVQTATERVAPGSVIVVDYLQVLDERRANPPLQSQVEALKAFAKDHQCILIFLCQLDREVEARRREPPTLEDIRLPNPLDLNLFNKVVFLNQAAEGGRDVEMRFADHDKEQIKASLVQAEAPSGGTAYRIEDAPSIA